MKRFIQLGFNINIFPLYLSSLYENLSIFEADVLESNKYNELDKARIRSSGVNLFVSVEDTLQQALSYITWALLSDHYLDTKFSYTYDDARDFMVETLDNFEYTSGEFLKLDKSGKNTLFPLITGLLSLSKMCDSLLSEQEKYVRPKSEFPEYYENAPLNFFPFEHKKLLFDIKPSELKALMNCIKGIVSEFGRGKVLETRNKLQHKRDDFPNQRELLATISSLQIIYSTLEEQGIYPDVHLFERSITDEFNRTEITLSNYKKKAKKILLQSCA